jgi:tetratricopeptide (TPR) repeat protein
MNHKLKGARIARCLSEKDVCMATGADIRSYQRWESGRVTPQPFYRKKLCDFFGLTLEQLGYDALTLIFSDLNERAAQETLLAPGKSVEHYGSLSIPSSLLDIGMIALNMAAQQYGWTREQLGEQVMDKIGNVDQQGTINRRDMITLLTGVTVAALSPLAQAVEEVLPHCEANLVTAWKLAKGSDLALAHSIVEMGLPALTAIAEKDSPAQYTAATLVAKSYLLNGLIAMHMGDMRGREAYCLQAVKYAEIADDQDLIAASNRWLGCTYFYLQEPDRALTIYKRAAKRIDSLTPLLRSSVLVETAVIQAQHKQKQDALRSLGQAEDFFAEASYDQNNLYIGHDIGVLTMWSGLTYYEVGEHQKALDTYLQIDGMKPKRPISERIRLQFLNNQALASLKLNDLDQACTYIEAAANGAIALGSKLRYNEAQKVYNIMDFMWSHEGRVQQIKPLFLKQL